jgi:hypothetical protein
VKRWLEFFSESEKVAARKSAGIVYTAKGKAA